MLISLSDASKLLRQLDDEHSSLIQRENDRIIFRAALGEDPETVRPEYSFAETQKLLSELEKRIRELRTSIHYLNATEKVDGFDMTISEMLVYLPQLSTRVKKFATMKNMLPKVRARSGYGNSNIVDYEYANFNVKEAAAAYREANDELMNAQRAIDSANSRVTVDCDVDGIKALLAASSETLN